MTRTTSALARHALGTALVLSLLLPTGANAAPLFEGYKVTVKENTSGWWTGTTGEVYVMQSPNVVTRKITSMAITTNDNYDWMEAGWYQLSTGGPKHKMWYAYDGVKYYHELGSATAGSTYTYTVRYYAPSGVGGYQWRVYIDGVMKTEDTVDFNDGRPKAGAERDTDGVPDDYTTNYAHEYALRRRDSNANWSSWTSLAQQDDNDPRFSLGSHGADYFYVVE